MLWAIFLFAVGPHQPLPTPPFRYDSKAICEMHTRDVVNPGVNYAICRPAPTGEVILDGKTEAFKCQFGILAKDRMPHAVTARDYVTGVVLFSAKSGDVVDPLCLNAPDGHPLAVVTDTPPQPAPSTE